MNYILEVQNTWKEEEYIKYAWLQRSGNYVQRSKMAHKN
jgi:hypothetical protein